MAIECPYCGYETDTNIHIWSEGKDSIGTNQPFNLNNMYFEVLKCSHGKCRKESLWIGYTDENKARLKRRIEPKSNAKIFPNYIPDKILQDYEEACLILEDSPKASAALARRCLQGMLLDFWEVKDTDLFKQIKSIEEKVPEYIYEALRGLKDIGNFGAHPTKIVDIEKKDAVALTNLLEILFSEWYVARHERGQRMEAVAKLGNKKKSQENQP